MDWVFCNKCSIKFQQSMKYYLGDCGHIVCERCVSSNTGNQQCLICKEPASTLELSKLMNPSMQMLFWPFENVIEQCYKVFKFQNMHRNLYVEALMTKYNFLKKEYLKNYAKTKMLRKENHFMKEKLQVSNN
ncbi:hypothetical protein ABEB36_009101 [Hypothenemus hampei]|uniref:RING-type domain-containing protein n=1 Tax=Hypothenemus hampei TaxID=57062 RepID=A0ABD1EPP0_HYPHA